eukprot:9669477-Alexandrium_andersonii.AAC.1
MRVVLVLGAERQESLNTATAGAVASFYDAHNEQYPLEGCFPPTLASPEGRCMARPDSEEVLALAEHRSDGAVAWTLISRRTPTR